MIRVFLCFLLITWGWTEFAAAQQLPRIPQGGFGSGGRPTAPMGGTSPGSGNGIIDDSTKQIYGPRTTRYFLEGDVLNNRKTLYMIDTLLEGIHQYNFVNRHNNQFVDLGNLGTALRPVFYEPPAIGAWPGLYAYAPYGYQTQQIRYFNTKSPFTDMYLVLGGRGQNILNFDFTQNIRPRLNAGFNIQRSSSDIQFGSDPNSSTSAANQRLTENWGLVLHTNYASKNEKYTVLFHYNNLNHRSLDQGGLDLGDTLEIREARFYQYDGTPILPNANSKETRNDLHLYQQYVLDQGFQLYNVIDFRNHYYRFADAQPLTGVAKGFYPTIHYDSTQTAQRLRFRLLENQIGLKGQFSGFNYRAWMRQRLYRLTNEFNTGPFLPDSSYRTNGFENFLGGWLGYYFPDSLTRVTAELEYLVGRDFRLQGRLESRWGSAGYESIFASPTLIQERFDGNHLRWRNNFGLRGTQHAYGRLNLRLGKLTLQPGLDYHLLTNYIYFDERAVPRQFSGAFSVVRTGLGYEFRAGRFGALGQGYYTLVSRDEFLRIPKLSANARFAYEFIFAKKLYIQTGVELHYKSAYYADQYMPLTQQFHLQNEFLLDRYLIADVFANFRINRVRLFVKLAHANQGLTVPGYYISPYFLGMRRSLAFSVHWPLFD